MNDGLKQRIIGALVLIALGIIFVPVIFDKERIVPVDRTTLIPPEPEIIAIPLPEPPKAPRPQLKEVQQPIDGEFDIEDEQSVESALAKNDVKPQALSEGSHAEKADKVAAWKDSTVSAWVMQIASYKDHERAEALRDTLKAQGYQAFVKTAKTSAGTRTRLFIGPTINKVQLQKAKEKIDRTYGVDAIISRYKP